jgi:hypothetical protein
MADNVTIEPAFGQQVAGEANKKNQKRVNAFYLRPAVRGTEWPHENFNSQEEPQELLHERRSH